MSDEQGFQFTPPQRREKKEFEPPPWESSQKAPGSEAVPAQETPVPPVKTAVLDESHVVAMLHELQAEEPPAGKEFNRIGIGAGILLIGVGVTFVIWSVVMISVTAQRPGQAGTGALFGIIVMALGVGFAGTGAWFIFRSLRHQGVL